MTKRNVSTAIDLTIKLYYYYYEKVQGTKQWMKNVGVEWCKIDVVSVQLGKIWIP